jgi:hypothetical protein
MSDHHLYRLSAAFELRRSGDLDPARRARLLAAVGTTAVAGFLIPTGTVEHATLKAVSPETADLLEHLYANPSRLPDQRWPTLSREHVLDLVGAEVLEIKVGDAYLTGLPALSAVVDNVVEQPRGRLATLSGRALAYAESLDLQDQGVLADRLYSYHRVAIRPAWRTSSASDQIRGSLDRAVPHRLRNDPRWMEFHHPPWRAHRRRDRDSGAELPRAKLYVSPTPEALPAVAAAVIPLIMEEPDAIGWKVAGTIEAAARPDKLIVYLDSSRSLRQIAGVLSRVLSGAEVHGVPFTCEIGLDGLLSWGLDPPAAPQGASALVDSWRTWVCARLAEGLVQAHRAGIAGPPARDAAVRRARAAGIDTATWAPGPQALAQVEGVSP